MKKKQTKPIDEFSNDTLSKEGLTVDLLDLLRNPVSNALEYVRLDGSETAVIFFTSEGTDCELHFCSETDINSYIHCNNEGCVLCVIGKRKEHRILLPVYLPASQSVGVLPVSPSLRPFALLPQIAPILQSKGPKVCFISREGSKFSVAFRGLTPDVDGGEKVIQAFLDKIAAGKTDLASVYSRIDNPQLAQVSEIARILKLKGVNPVDIS